MTNYHGTNDLRVTHHGLSSPAPSPSFAFRCLCGSGLSSIIFINRNGLRWCDAPREYGPAKTLYNRWKRWSDNGVFARIMVGLAAKDADPKTIMIDATYLKAHRTASSLCVKKGGAGARSGEPKAA